MVSILILPKQIAAIHFVCHIFDVVSDAVGYDHISLCLELRQVIHHPGVEEFFNVGGCRQNAFAFTESPY